MNIERIREICLQLPHTFEGIKYGDKLCFSVGIPLEKGGSKVFCSSNIKNLDRINFKVPDEIFEELCEKEGISPAPYAGVRFKYVQVAGFDFLTDKEWIFYIHQSYALLKADLPKKVLAILENN